MIKLSDYLDYLNNEIIQARKMADENAIRVAKLYAEHQYLKYFKVPRYSMPSIKMDVPLKIADIDADSKFEFNFDKKLIINEINDKIQRTNIEKKINIPPVNEDFLKSDGMVMFLKSMESPITKQNSNLPIRTIPFQPISPTIKNISDLPMSQILKPINVTVLVKAMDLKYFKINPKVTDQESTELRDIVADSFSTKYKMVNSKLNAIFIDPDTTKNDDKDKLFLNLHVEMEEESIRLVRLQDDKGNVMEEITFD
ncbi:MAG: hypothetical protein JST62_00655 [Bacteroidetes bacterium]|jgi:hypothetical protein|nr:hypothetical protein [Bacteroidota bacterium]